ncbi:MAG: NAD(P)-dependent oxidoreductase [bacterium]
MKHILMTGLTGYLGSRLARRFVMDPTIKLSALKRSFSDIHPIADIVDRITCYDVDRVPPRTAFENDHVNLVIHCATNYGRHHESRSSIVDANLVLPLTLLEASVEHGVKAFINTDTMLDKGISDYSLSKKQFNDWLQVYGTELLAVNVALEHFFGPGDDPSKFVSCVVRELIKGVDRIPLTPGEQCRDFVFIDDVVSAFEHVVNYVNNRDPLAKGYEAFEVGRGVSVSVKDFLLLMRDISGNNKTKLDFGALPYRPNEVMSVKADISKVSALGWSPKVALPDALQRTIDEDRKLI